MSNLSIEQRVICIVALIVWLGVPYWVGNQMGPPRSLEGGETLVFWFAAFAWSAVCFLVTIWLVDRSERDWRG